MPSHLSAVDLVVIPCGGKKRPTRSKARYLYTGPYHQACQEFALSLAPDSRVLILSAKYGLVGMDEVIAPYDLTMGDEGSVSGDFVAGQADDRGLLGLDANGGRVVALGGAKYVRICKSVWPLCETPLDGVGGIGRQIGWLKRAARGEY